MKKHLIKKAEQGISFSGFDEKWGNRAREVYGKNKDAAVWKQIAGDDDTITLDEFKQWQKSNGTVGDGKIGKNTLKKLGFNSNHNWIARDIHRPQIVFRTGLDIPEEELRERHPLKWKEVQTDKAKDALRIAQNANTLNQAAGTDSNQYHYSIVNTKEGLRPNVVNQTLANQNYERVKELEQQLKEMQAAGVDPNSEEYDKLYSEYWSLKFDSNTTPLQELVVAANPIYAADKNSDGTLTARENWLPVETEEGSPYTGRVFRKTYGPEQYYITNGRGWLMGTSNDPGILLADPSKATKAMWDTQRMDALMHDVNMLGYDETANEETTQRVKNLWNPNTGQYGISTKDLITSMNNGKRQFITGASMIANMPNHAIMGAGKAVFDDDYSWSDYTNGFLGNPKNQIIGAGDAFDVENPYLRTGLNFINPMSVAQGTATFIASQPEMTLRVIPGVKSQIKVPNSNGKVLGGVLKKGVHRSTKYRNDVVPISIGGTHTEVVRTPSQLVPTFVPGVEGTYVISNGVRLPQEKIERKQWTPSYQGTEEVSLNPVLEERLRTGVYGDAPYIPATDENTQGGNFKWNAQNGRTIVSLPGTGHNRNTSYKPSK